MSRKAACLQVLHIEYVIACLMYMRMVIGGVHFILLCRSIPAEKTAGQFPGTAKDTPAHEQGDSS